MLEGLGLIFLVSTLTYSTVDAVKLILGKLNTRISVYPLLALMLSVFYAVELHASIFKVLGIDFYDFQLVAYIITGVLASLGAEQLHERFGHLLVRKKDSENYYIEV